MNFIEPMDPLIKENKNIDLFYADEKMIQTLLNNDLETYLQYIRNKQKYINEKPLLEKENEYLKEEIELLKNEINLLKNIIEDNKYVKSNEKYKKQIIQDIFDGFDKLDKNIKTELNK